MRLCNLTTAEGGFARPVFESPVSEELSLGRKVLQELSEQMLSSEDADRVWFSDYLRKLRGERNSKLLFHGLFSAAQHFKSFKTKSHDADAQAILGRLSQADLPAWVRQKAETETSAWGGSFGMQFELLFSRLPRAATDWHSFLPVLGAGLVGNFVGAATFGRIVGMMGKGALPWVAEGVGARLGAGVLSYLAEVPVYTELNRALSAEPAGSFLQDLKPVALPFAAMRAFGGLGNAVARVVTPVGASPGGRAFFTSQLFGLLGLMSTQKLEGYLEHRPEVSLSTLFLDSLASVMHFGVSTQMGSWLPGEGGLAQLRNELEFRSRVSQPFSVKPNLRPTAGAGFALQAAGQGRRPSDKGEVFQPPQMMMDTKGIGSSVKISLPTAGTKKDPYIDRMLDNYKINKFIGNGGVGDVYLATHVKLKDERVALKILRILDNPEIIERFIREGQILAQIKHPHIVAVRDVRDYKGTPFIVMDYLEGKSLSDLIEESGGKVSFPEAVKIVWQIADGLEAAHKAGIVHRDLKPDNIRLVKQDSEDNYVKVIDFGIAKDLKEKDGLTQNGQTFGTPRYMSPEQIDSDVSPVDARSDVYSLGVLLHEITTGKGPFAPINDKEGGLEGLGVLTNHLITPPVPLRDRDPGIPQEFADLADRCLAKAAADRPQSMGEVKAVLEQFMRPGAPGALPPESPTLALTLWRRPTQAQKVPPEITLQMRRRLPRRRLPLWLGIGSGAAASTVAAVILSNRRSKPVPLADANPMHPQPDAGKVSNLNPSPPNASPPELEPVPPVGKTEVTLSGVPKGAHVYRVVSDDEKVLLKGNPIVVVVEKDASVELEIRCSGFKTKKITLDGKRDKFPVQMEPEVQKPPPKKKKEIKIYVPF